MPHRWDDFTLDREAMLLTRGGQQVDVSRKTLICIYHLIENRDRVVGFDELMRQLWGHESVTNHQLSQVILSARRTIGDSGHAQRLIRTAPGLGFRWVGPLKDGDNPEVAESRETPAADAPETFDIPPGETTPPGVEATPSQIDAPEPSGAPASAIEESPPRTETSEERMAPPAASGPAPKVDRHRGAYIAWTAVAVFIIALGFSAAHVWRRDVPAAQDAVKTMPSNPLASLASALEAGKYEDVRTGLAQLSPEAADSPEAKLLEIELDLYRGRAKIASEKLAREKSRAEASNDPLWQARTLIVEARILSRSASSQGDMTEVAQAALDLLEAMGDAAPAHDIAGALRVRALGLMQAGRLDDAARDLVRARDLLVSTGDGTTALSVRSNLARVWMRMGRLRDALDDLQALLQDHRKDGDVVSQIYDLITISRIHAELLHWDEALSANDEALRLLRTIPESDRRHRALLARIFILSGKGRFHEASAQLEELQQLKSQDDAVSPAIEAAFHLESGDRAAAFARLQVIADHGPYEHQFNPMLEDAEGPLLLWILATRDAAANGAAFPAMPATLRRMLDQPKAAAGHIALGHWLAFNGKPEQAEAAFRLALQESRRMGHTYRMTLAAEGLIRLLLDRGDVEGAEIVLIDLRAFQPIYIDRDYRSSLLGLRVALAKNDPIASRKAYRQARALAGERKLPADVLERYRNTAGRQAATPPQAVSPSLTQRR